MTKLVCTTCERPHKAPFHPLAEDFICGCGGRRVLPSQAKPRAPLKAVSEKRATENVAKGRPAKAPSLKQGRGFAASPAQQAKAREGACLITGEEVVKGATVDPAHVTPRGMGGCDHPDCVVPLRRDLHERFDAGDLSILGALVPDNNPAAYRAELIHALDHYDWSFTRLLRRLTGERHLPESEIDRLVAARLAA